MSPKKFLNKDTNCFLKQSIAENILPQSQLKKTNRKKRFITVSYQNRINSKHSPQRSSTSSGFNRSNKVKEAEMQIVREFLRKREQSSLDLWEDRNRVPAKGGTKYLSTEGKTGTEFCAQQSWARQREVRKHLSPLGKRQRLFPQGRRFEGKEIGKNIVTAKQDPANTSSIEQDPTHRAGLNDGSLFSVGTFFQHTSEQGVISTSTGVKSSNVFCDLQHSHKAGFFLIHESASKTPNHLFCSMQELQAPNTFPSVNTLSITEKNVSLLFSIEQIRNLLVAKRIERQTRSQLRNQLLESRKICLLYGGLSNKQLRRNIQKGRKLPGNAGDNLLVLLESRLDVVLQRCGFFQNVRTARQSIVHQQVYVNSRIVSAPGYQLQSGDVIQLEPLKTKKFRSGSILQMSKNNCFSPLQETESSRHQARNTLALLKKLKWEFSVPPSMLYSLLQLESFLSANFTLLTRKISNQQKTQRSGFFLKAQQRKYLLQDKRVAQQSCATRNQSTYELSDPKNVLALIRQLVQKSELHFLTEKKVPLSNLFLKKMILSTNVEVLKRGTSIVSPLGEKHEVLFPNGEENDLTFSRKQKDKSLSQTNRCVLQSKNPVQHHYLGKQIILGTFSELYAQKHDHNTDLFLKSQMLSEGKTESSDAERKKNDYILSSKDILSAFYPSESAPISCTKNADLSKKLYNTYSYWLEVKKRLASSPQNRDKEGTEHFNTFLKDQVCFQEKRSKPLHLEVSYQSCNAIFLYAPQRVYLPALVDLDLLVKAL